MRPETPRLLSARVSGDPGPHFRASWAVLGPRFSDALHQFASTRHLGPGPDAIIAVCRQPTRVVEIQAAESPETQGDSGSWHWNSSRGG